MGVAGLGEAEGAVEEDLVEEETVEEVVAVEEVDLELWGLCREAEAVSHYDSPFCSACRTLDSIVLQSCSFSHQRMPWNMRLDGLQVCIDRSRLGLRLGRTIHCCTPRSTIVACTYTYIYVSPVESHFSA